MPNVEMVVTNVKVAEATAEESTSRTASWGSTCAAMPELKDCSFVDMRSGEHIV